MTDNDKVITELQGGIIRNQQQITLQFLLITEIFFLHLLQDLFDWFFHISLLR